MSDTVHVIGTARSVVPDMCRRWAFELHVIWMVSFALPGEHNLVSRRVVFWLCIRCTVRFGRCRGVPGMLQVVGWLIACASCIAHISMGGMFLGVFGWCLAISMVPSGAYGSVLSAPVCLGSGIIVVCVVIVPVSTGKMATFDVLVPAF